MNEQELLSKINTAFSNAAPNVLDSVRSQCQEQKGTVIPLKQPEKKKTVWKRFASMAAALILVAGLGFGIGAYHSGQIAFDVCQKDRDSRVTEGFCQNLQGDGLSGSGGACDKAMTVCHGREQVLRAAVRA